MTTTTAPSPHCVAPGAAPATPPGRLRRSLRGDPTDPAWVRPGVVALLVATAVGYLSDLSASGYANSFYAAAVQAGTQSWKAFLFGSSDAANFITVDKPPAALWVMELSARVFGLSSWSLLAPQAVEGVAAVGLLYLAVRRVATPAAGLIAGGVLAVTPVAALMFRYDNPDALLVLLLVAAAYATTRYLDGGRAAWLAGAGALVGLGFLTKSLQAFVVVPVLAGLVLAVSARPLRRRIRDLLVAGAALVVAGGWWVAVVQLTPASDRPYIGGSQDNSLWNVIFGYNGFGRLTGNETGSVGGGGGGGGSGQWGPTGITRMFNSAFGGQISWLLPASLALLVGGLVVTRRARRTDRTRTGLLLWGGWLVVTGLLFSLSRGIIHPYYTVALAPAVAAVVGIGTAVVWERRRHWLGRVALAVTVALAAGWSWELLDRTPTWHPWIRTVVLVAGGVAVVGLLLVRPGTARRLAAPVAGLAVVAALAGPLASTLSTITTPHSGAIPSAGPAVGRSLPPGVHFGGRFGGAGGSGRIAGGGGFGGARGSTGGTFPGGSSGAAGGTGAVPGGSTGGSAAPGATARPSGGGHFGGGPFGGGNFGGGPFGGGGGGGLLGSSTPSAAVVGLLEEDHGAYTWAAATTGSEPASGYPLATRLPVMAIGGFNGTDPAPTLAAFEADVRAGRIHWYIASSSGGFGGSTTDDAAQIQAWVEKTFTARTVDGVTLYDLGAGAS
jgi:4-amino-4-deoxy-L-arabinose transferase-like glycosyltransferase